MGIQLDYALDVSTASCSKSPQNVEARAISAQVYSSNIFLTSANLFCFEFSEPIFEVCIAAKE